jgi:hypothetical protein
MFGDVMPLLWTITDSSTREAIIEMLTLLMNCKLKEHHSTVYSVKTDIVDVCHTCASKRAHMETSIVPQF